jgi:hypothetical protein
MASSPEAVVVEPIPALVWMITSVDEVRRAS